jgi:hypothetical protein
MTLKALNLISETLFEENSVDVIVYKHEFVLYILCVLYLRPTPHHRVTSVLACPLFDILLNKYFPAG